MSGKMTFVFWNVQHGSATYIRTPNNKHIAIDLGSGSLGNSDESFSPLLYLKNKWGVKQLDGVIITHPHRDHLDDIENFEMLSPKVLSRPKHISEDDIRKDNPSGAKEKIDKYIAINNRYTEPVLQEENPFLPVNNGGVSFQRYTPTSCSTSNLNNHSMVTVISYEPWKVIVPGDNEPESWEELLQRNDFVEAIKGTDILVAPHHGRDSGFPTELFSHISPYLIIISDGEFSDTSATDRFDQQVKGWNIFKESEKSFVERKCLTTRNDGVIIVEFILTEDNESYMEVTIA